MPRTFVSQIVKGGRGDLRACAGIAAGPEYLPTYAEAVLQKRREQRLCAAASMDSIRSSTLQQSICDVLAVCLTKCST
jgi:hypothetical protein